MAQQIPISPVARADDAKADRERDDGTHELTPDLAYRRLVMVNVVFVGRPDAGDRGWVLIDAGIPGTKGSIKGAAAERFATHPSDMCVALTVLEATVRVSGPEGERSIPFDEYHRLPGDDPSKDNTLKPDEIVVSVDLPANGFPTNYIYLKLRDRLSYAFALVSVAAALELDGQTIKTARLALGGVAHKPWRNREAEALLQGMPANRESFQAAADQIISEAKPQSENGFKVELARRAIVRGLEQATAGTPQTLSDKRIQ